MFFVYVWGSIWPFLSLVGSVEFGRDWHKSWRKKEFLTSALLPGWPGDFQRSKVEAGDREERGSASELVWLPVQWGQSLYCFSWFLLQLREWSAGTALLCDVLSWVLSNFSVLAVPWPLGSSCLTLPGTLCAFFFFFWLPVNCCLPAVSSWGSTVFGEEPSVGEVVVIFHPVLRSGLGIMNMVCSRTKKAPEVWPRLTLVGEYSIWGQETYEQAQWPAWWLCRRDSTFFVACFKIHDHPLSSPMAKCLDLVLKYMFTCCDIWEGKKLPLPKAKFRW